MAGQASRPRPRTKGVDKMKPSRHFRRRRARSTRGALLCILLGGMLPSLAMAELVWQTGTSM